MPVESRAGFLIALIHRAGNRIFNRLLKAVRIDLNPAQGRILFVLWETDRIPISELAAKSGLKKSTLTGMLDRLEQGGLIVRVPSTEDRRTVLVCRTAKDKALQERYQAVSRAMIDLTYKGFDRGEMRLFEGMLDRIRTNFEEAERDS